MDRFSEHIPSLFLPVINILQERSLDKRLNFELDLQNNELYVLQELTRCSALLNHINFKGRPTLSDNKSKVNSVFDNFLKIDDPMAVFIDNFEHFFALYIHSKYGKDNFKLYMKKCEKSPVAYPINVFQQGLCIFMQYNTLELRNYVYTMLTMFYYYTGQDFYEMICPLSCKTPRPNNYDEYNDFDMEKNAQSSSSSSAAAARIEKKNNILKSHNDKLCFLNRRNYNINKPVMSHHQETRIDTLSMTSNFEKCILLDSIRNEKHKPGILAGKQTSKPVCTQDILTMRENNILPVANCKNNGMNQNTQVFKLSDHLKNSCDFTKNSGNDSSSSNNNNNNNNDFIFKKSNNTKYVQTNFSTVWSNINRRQLVSLNIIYSIMNVCILKITNSLTENKNKNKKQHRNNDKLNGNNCEEKMFRCVRNPNDIEYDINGSDDDDDDDDGNDDNNDDKNDNVFKTINKNRNLSRLKRPTIEVSFKQNSSTASHSQQILNNFKINNLKFSS